jgi:hypothetical protein
MDTNRRDELIRGAVDRQFSGVDAQKRRASAFAWPFDCRRGRSLCLIESDAYQRFGSLLGGCSCAGVRFGSFPLGGGYVGNGGGCLLKARSNVRQPNP